MALESLYYKPVAPIHTSLPITTSRVISELAMTVGQLLNLSVPLTSSYKVRLIIDTPSKVL